MTVLTVAQPSCQGDGGPGELGGLFVPPAPGRRGDPASPRRRGDVPPLSLPDPVPGELQPLLPLRSYRWQSADNGECAQRWLQAALRILADTSPSYSRQPGSASDSIDFLVRQTLDVHHYDRAQAAAAYLPTRPTPQRLAAIPAWLAVVESPDARPRRYHRQLTTLRYASDVPHFATDSVASLPPAVLPDSWSVVTYVRRQRVDDPFLFAQYGAWYLQVAAWE